MTWNGGGKSYSTRMLILRWIVEKPLYTPEFKGKAFSREIGILYKLYQLLPLHILINTITYTHTKIIWLLYSHILLGLSTKKLQKQLKSLVIIITK